MERQNVQDPQGRGAGARQEDRGQKWMDSGLLLKAGMMGHGLGWMELGKGSFLLRNRCLRDGGGPSPRHSR